MADTEYISKEAALACFSDWIDRYGHEHTADEMVEYQKIEELPAADVREVVRGRWEKLGKYDSGFVGVTDDGDQLCLPTSKCSNCKKPVALVMWRNFCPNCGADMTPHSNGEK